MTGTVTVACKLPNGLHLDVENASGEKVRKTIRGNSLPFGAPDNLHGGYAITEVDADHWAAWLAKHKESSLVKDQIVFATQKADATVKAAAEREAVPAVAPRLKKDAVKGVSEADKE